jgi:hypothetical protein
MTSKMTVWALILTGMFAMPAGAQSGEGVGSQQEMTDRTTSQDQSLGAPAHKGGPHQVEGSWAFTVRAVTPPGIVIPPRHVYATFSHGGAFIGSDRNSPFGSPQHGAWVYTGVDEFAFTFIQDLFDAAGVFLGTAKIRARLTVTGEDELVGVSSGELRDADGNLVRIPGCSTIRGERITVEPLPPQCQGIVPPQ